MDELTEKELQSLINLVRTRMRYEARRPAKFSQGVDLQQMKTIQLSLIAEKLEKELNNR